MDDTHHNENHDQAFARVHVPAPIHDVLYNFSAAGCRIFTPGQPDKGLEYCRKQIGPGIDNEDRQISGPGYRKSTQHRSDDR